MSEYYYWAAAALKECERIRNPKKREACISDVLETVRIERELEEGLWW